MKKLIAVAALAFCLPVYGQAARPASASAITSGVFLSTNLSAVVVRLNRAIGFASGATFGGRSDADTSTSGSCSGGLCSAAIGGPTLGCKLSPENGTALLAVLGVAGLLIGRFGYRLVSSSNKVETLSPV